MIFCVVERIRGGSPLVFCTGNRHNISLIALDMDGTLLNSQSQILPSSKEAILAAISKGIKVTLATGKARPAALAACKKVGLAGQDHHLIIPLIFACPV